MNPNDDLLIQKTTLPEREFHFNEIAQNIHEQLNKCYDQTKKFLHDEQKHFATGWRNPAFYSRSTRK